MAGNVTEERVGPRLHLAEIQERLLAVGQITGLGPALEDEVVGDRTLVRHIDDHVTGRNGEIAGDRELVEIDDRGDRVVGHGRGLCDRARYGVVSRAGRSDECEDGQECHDDA